MYRSDLRGHWAGAAALCLLVYIPVVNVKRDRSYGARPRGQSDYRGDGQCADESTRARLFVWNSSGTVYEVDVPEIVLALLDVLSQPALPLELLAVGAGIRFLSFGRQSWQLAAAVLGKLLIFPALVAVATQPTGVHPDLAAVLLLLTCLPAPPSAYILARQLGGDVSLMANTLPCRR